METQSKAEHEGLSANYQAFLETDNWWRTAKKVLLKYRLKYTYVWIEWHLAIELDSE